MKAFFQRNWQHFAVIGVFFILTFFYFAPQFDGYNIKQHDVEQFKGMAHETQMFREQFGEEPLWTNAMFGGMPTTQISVLYPGNIFQTVLLSFFDFFGMPTGIFLLHLLGFYFLSQVLKVKPIIGFIGAIAFALASYEIVILQAGHNSKAATVALMAPVIGAFIMTYRNNWKMGALLSGIFMAFNLASNHLQVTYYMAFLLGGLGIYQLIVAFKKKEIKQFGIASAAILVMYGLSVFINYGNISLTNDYAKNTIRGGNDITIATDGSPSKINTTGLDKEYITNWSYGVGESFTLLSPYVKGSATAMLADTKFADMVTDSDRPSSEIKTIMEAPYGLYWGDQPMTSGPVYIGVVMIFLLVLGMVFIKDGSKWVFLGVSILALALSWGKNFMGLTDFFIENVPGYNKFRTVTIIMVLIELCVPIIGILLLERLWSAREEIVQEKKKFLIVSGVFLVFLVGVKGMGLDDNYTNKAELERIELLPEQIAGQISEVDPQVLQQNYGVDVNNPQQIQQFIDAQVENSTQSYDLMKSVRADIFDSSMNRSILFAVLAIGLLALMFFTQINALFVYVGLAAVVLMDLIPVSQNYLSAEEGANSEYKYWVTREEALYPVTATEADQQIMDMESLNPKVKSAIAKGEKLGEAKASELNYTGAAKRRVIDAYKFSALNFATDYRIFDFENPWGSSRSSYFHKALGGYHGAKLRNIQNLFEFQIAQSNNKVFDMLNVKYFIQNGATRPNPTALGNAWFVKNVKSFETPNEEIRALGATFELANAGQGKLLINGAESKFGTVYGTEKMQYLLAGKDTMEIRIINGLSKGLTALFVMDTNGVTNYIPEQTLLADTLRSFTTLAKITMKSEFVPAEDAVMLKSEMKNLKSTNYSGKGTITLTKYAPNKLNYTANVEGSQLAVFSEIYYKDGWKAYVNGSEKPILKVNYLLRGLELSNGKNNIEFRFELPKYQSSNSYARIGTILLLLIGGGLLYTEWRKRKIS
ncbi:MAG: YfhO family protein [Bacteroidota bacterium]